MLHSDQQNHFVGAHLMPRRRALLSVAACVLMLIAGGVLPADAQSRGKGMSDLFKELRKGKDFTGCVGKVQAAGYANAPVLGVTDSVMVNVTCDDGSSAGGLAPKGREQEVLSVALAALNTGKSVQVIADEKRTIVIFGIFTGGRR
jgi:hypothetical protein